MLAFPGTSHAGGAAGGKTSIAASTIFGGAGAGYDASTGSTIPAGAGNNASGGGVGLNGAAGALTPASGGGGGGIGSNITSAGNLINPVTGGAGGLSPSSAGAGGGGDGVVLSSGGTLNVAVTGGAGGQATSNAGGGGGGAGVVDTSTDTLTITKAVTGGAGGQAVHYAGGGGSGVWVTSAGNLAVTTGSVTGGTGGLGAAAATITGGNDNGGGGAGVVFSAAGATLDVSGRVSGGNVNATTGGMGGIGGAGVNILSGGVKVTVESGGSIVGGTGGSQAGGAGFAAVGAGGTGSGGTLGGVSFVGSAGGVGIAAAGGGNTIVTSGAIKGGMAGATQANAITFSGIVGNNTLELLSGYSFTGDVVAQGVLDPNHLVLGGDTSPAASFDVSRIGAAPGSNTTAYTGFKTFQKTGASTWTLTGTTTAVTPWTVSGGTLSVSSDGALGDTSGDLTLDGGTLQNTDTFTTARNVDLTANGGTLDTAGADLTLSGVVSGQGGLTKAGDGSLILTGENTYTGGTSITAGTVQVGDGGTTGSLLGDVATSTGTTLAFDHSDPYAFGGVISGAGALNQMGSGTLVLTGENTYTGGTSITAGTVQVGDGGTTGSLVGDVATSTGTTLAFDHSDPYAFGGVISGAGALNQMGSGTLVLTGENTYTGGTSITAGTVQVGDGGTTGSLLGDVATSTGTTLAFDHSDPYAFGGVISGAGALNQMGSGTLVLTGANTYTGGTSITAGTVQVGDGGTTGSLVGDVATSTGTTLAFDHSDPYAFGGVISGAGALNQMGSGTLVLTGENTYTGGTSITAGTVQVGDGGTTGSLLGDVATSTGTTLAFDHSDPYAFGGVISGAGALNQMGSGTLVLTGENTYTGGTSITAGTVQVGDGGTTGSLVGDVATSTGTTLAFDHSDPYAFGGVISGAGALNQMGSGTLVLTGENTYTGGTSITAGTVQVGDGGTTGSLLGDVATSTGTTLAFDHSDPYAFGGVISGAGALNQMGSGTLVLTGANTYTGGTSITAGTVQVGDGGTTGSLVGDVATSTGTTLAFDHSDPYAFGGVISGAGALNQMGSGTLVLTGENTYTGGTSITAGTVQVGDGGTTGSLLGDVATSTGTTLAFDHSDPYAFGGVISGNGALSQIGTGTLSLTGDSSAFTGASDVGAGTLEVDGKLGGTLTVDSGATLSGIGTVGTTTLANGAILAPGNSATPVGTLNVNGNLTFAPGSTYQVQIPPGSTTSSLVNVSGTANLAGSVVHLGENGNYAGSSTYTILTANQLNGSFDSVSSNLAFLTPSLVYDAHDVMLRLQMKENFADAAVTHNQRAVANALQSLPAGSDLYNRILNLPNGAPPAAFNALSGESHASTASVLQGVTDNVIKLPMDHLRSKLDAVDVASPEAEQPVWVQVFGNSRTLGGNSNSAKVEESDGGVFVGADRLIDNGWRVGGALGYTDSHSTVSDRSSKFAIDSYSATVYGGKAFDAGPGKINLTAGAAYTWSDIDSRRDVNAAGLDQALKSTSGASTGQVFSELGYALPLNNHATIEPFVGAAFSDQRLRGFSESGGSTALDGESKTNDTTTTTLGLHAKTALTALQLQGHLYGTVGLRHAFGDVTPETTMAFEGSQPFTVAGAPIARNAAVTEVGADVAVSKNTTVGVSYSGQFGAGYQQNAGSINANWRF
ncbi:autotransporter [Pseudomonas yamanorum]|uniref:autotransporter-associated beta strand repeat-containing protein n=1 Tax=Pseudomonas yamanorum TaxID=515393 RepID=UPI0007A6543D|nr:autotransporter-associated beta strand repeat-containing protein [Pseudomonas yamanorum]AMW83886.1 autotransporter [Pseudomonas yamanorum]